MMLRHVMQAAIAPVVGLVLFVAPSSQAATVQAAALLAACPGPIFIDEDTTLTGAAKVTGDCTLSTPAGADLGPQINLSKATLSFTGSFQILGNASSMSVDRSKVTAGLDLILDSFGVMTITNSRLVANGGSVTLPPRRALSITGSHLAAQGNVTLGGPGGRRDVINSTLQANGEVVIAPSSSTEVPGSITVRRSTLSAMTLVNINGFLIPEGDQPAVSIDNSTLEALGKFAEVRIAPGGSFVTHRIEISNGTTVRAPAGWIFVAGTHRTFIEDSSFSSAADAFGRGMILGGAVTPNFFRSEFRSRQGSIQIWGSDGGPWAIEDCLLLAGGPVGIQIGTPRAPSIRGSVFQAPAGPIKIFSRGPLSIEQSSLWARHPDGIAIGTDTDRTIVDSKFDAPLGPIAIRGPGLNYIAETVMTAMNQGGILLSGGMSQVGSSRLFTLGSLTTQNFGSAVAASTIKADAGLLTETSGGGSSLLTGSEVRAASVIVRSFDDTTVTDNRLAAATYEFSAAGTCTSAGNVPNIPCF